MRIAIAGGNGFVGREVTRVAIGRGHEVVWLSHRVGRPGRPGGVLEVEFDPTRTDDEWAAEVTRADAVVNLSGYPIASRWNPHVKELLRSSRLDTAAALVSAIGAARSGGAGPSVYVGACGIGIFGDCGDKLLAEDSPTGGDWLADLAVDWEAATLSAADTGARAVSVRTGLALGDEGLVPKMALPFRLFVGGPVGNGRQWMSWIHHRDLARAYVHAVECEMLEGPVNTCAPAPVTMRDFARALGGALHRPSWLPVPGFALRIVLGEVGPYTLMSQRASCAKLVRTGFEFEFAEVAAALSDVVG